MSCSLPRFCSSIRSRAFGNLTAADGEKSSEQDCRNGATLDCEHVVAVRVRSAFRLSGSLRRWATEHRPLGIAARRSVRITRIAAQSPRSDRDARESSRARGIAARPSRNFTSIRTTCEHPAPCAPRSPLVSTVARLARSGVSIDKQLKNLDDKVEQVFVDAGTSERLGWY